MIDVAVLGATGAVGQRFIQLLDGHSQFVLAEVAASDRSAGQRYEEATRWLQVTPMPQAAKGLRIKRLGDPLSSRIVFSALPPDVAGPLEDQLADDGHVVSTNARNHRMDSDVPLLIPEINADHTRAVKLQEVRRGCSGYIVANANCSTIVLSLALKPLWDAFGLEQVLVTSMQALSGAGYPGVSALDMIDNMIPYIDGEEEKLETEPRKILGGWDGVFDTADFAIGAQCNRVAVLDGHTLSMSVKLREPASVHDVEECFESFAPASTALHLPTAPAPVLRLALHHDRPQPRLDRDAGGGMAVTIGRVKPCNVLDYRFIALGHNTIRGAAGGAILNAELLVAQGLVGGI